MSIKHLGNSLVLFLCLFHGMSWSQTTTSEIRGVTVDASNKTVIPFVKIQITHAPTGTLHNLISNADGLYFLPQLIAGGPYVITVKNIGYKDFREENIFLALGETKEIDLRLDPSVQELGEVEVVGNSNDNFANKQKGMETNISNETIGKLPTINRSLQDVTKLAPQSGGNSFGGSNYRFNNLSVDGTANNDAFGFQEPSVGAGGSVASGSPGALSGTQPISLDAVGQVQVSLSPFDVKIGNFTGANINVVTKNGTNKLESSIYFFGRNQHLIGKNLGAQRLDLDNFFDLQSGFRVGGALKKNKLFYFINAEIGQRSQPVAFAPGTAGSAFNLVDIQAFSDTLLSRYNYDVGTFSDAAIASTNEKLFIRFDWNINEKNQLIVRNNLIHGRGENFFRSPTILNFGSQAFTHNSINNSSVVELKTKLKSSLFNNLIVGFNSLNDTRNPEGELFPHIEITYNTSSTIFAGSYREASVFQLKQKTLEFSDNLTYYKNKNKFTFGTHNELYFFDYHFVTPYTGRWSYSSLENFYANKPSRIRSTYNLNNNDYAHNRENPSADFNVLLSSFYVQDDIKVNDKFNIALGVRLEGNLFLSNQMTSFTSNNPDFDATGNIGIRNQFIIAPRFGFSYDVLGDKSLKLRGGSGIFSGRMPFAWAAYSYIYNGTQFGNVDIRPTNSVDLVTSDFEDLAQLQPNKNEINIVDENFKLPRIWRSSLAVDYKLGKKFLFTLEGVFTKTIYDVLFQTKNLRDSTTAIQGNGNDDRPVFLGSGDDRFFNSQYTSVFYLTNTTKGYRNGFTASLQGEVLKHLNFTLIYNYGISKDLMNGVRVSPQANWEWNQTSDANAPSLSYSNFDIRHRIVNVVNYEFKTKKSKTLLSFVFSSQSGSPFSFVYTGDLNRDGSPTNDLLYVPNSASDINLVDITDAAGNVLVSKETQWSQLDAYISGNPYLESKRGQVTERNGARTPWNTQLDMRITHEISLKIKEQTHKLEFSLDVMNLTQLLYNKWGRQYFVPNTTNSGYSLLTVKSVNSSTGLAEFRFNNPTTTPWQIDPILSRWQMQLGVRYTF